MDCGSRLGRIAMASMLGAIFAVSSAAPATAAATLGGRQFVGAVAVADQYCHPVDNFGGSGSFKSSGSVEPEPGWGEGRLGSYEISGRWSWTGNYPEFGQQASSHVEASFTAALPEGTASGVLSSDEFHAGDCLDGAVWHGQEVAYSVVIETSTGAVTETGTADLGFSANWDPSYGRADGFTLTRIRRDPNAGPAPGPEPAPGPGSGGGGGGGGGADDRKMPGVVGADCSGGDPAGEFTVDTLDLADEFDHISLTAGAKPLAGALGVGLGVLGAACTAGDLWDEPVDGAGWP